MDKNLDTSRKVRLRARVTEFSYPPVHDGIVIGRSAPLGLEAFRKAINLLVSAPFEHVPVEDEIISDILVRSAVLRRVSPERFVQFVLRQIKPLMSPEEILHLDLEPEIEIEAEGL